MLSVSTPALEQLHNSLMVSSDPSKCFRMVIANKTKLELKYAEFEESDQTFDYSGRVVLALPDGLEKFCEDKAIDVNKKGRLEISIAH